MADEASLENLTGNASTDAPKTRESAAIDVGDSKKDEDNKFIQTKTRLENRESTLIKRKEETRTNAEKALKHYELIRGEPPSEETTQQIMSSVEGIDYALTTVRDKLIFLRPTIETDIEYRSRTHDNLADLIKKNVPTNLPLRFHGTPIYRARDIISSGALLASEDRLGISTAGYTTSGAVSVTTPETVDTTIDYSGLTEENYQIPAGCIFVLLPGSEKDAASGSSMMMGNVDFREHPEQLFRVLASPEMVGVVGDWLEGSGVDRSKAIKFLDFPDQLKQLKTDADSGKASTDTLKPYNNVTSI